MANSDPWLFFDKIYCISIAERTDRREEAKRQFAKVGLEGKVEFVIVRKHPLNQEQGIYESHLLCLRKAIEAEASHLLIFEDDILFTGFNPESLREALKALAAVGEWDLFFLGCLVSRSQKTENPNLLQIRYCALTHAYGMSRAFAETAVKIPWAGIPYDLFLKRAQKKAYALYPAFAFQSNARTDNRLLFLERVRRICGGLAWIQKINELYQRHKLTLIMAHLVAVGVLLLLAWR